MTEIYWILHPNAYAIPELLFQSQCEMIWNSRNLIELLMISDESIIHLNEELITLIVETEKEAEKPTLTV